MSDDLVSRLREHAEWGEAGPKANDGKLLCEAAQVLTEARAEIERLRNLLGDPEGTIAHADAITARAEKAESALAEARKVIEPIVSRLEWDGHMQRWALAPDMPAGSITAARRFIASQEPAEQEK